MSAYSQWTLSEARGVVRRELMDSTSRWWSDEWLNSQISNWQSDLQEEYEFVWGSSSVVTASNTISLSSLTPSLHRLDAVYFSTSSADRGYRLAGRGLQDLEIEHQLWRDSEASTPREIVQRDSEGIIIWPPPVATSTFTFEYPRRLSLDDDSSTISLPAWTQPSLRPYVAWHSYLRPGQTNDLQRALRYKAKYEREKLRIKSLWDQWLPERFRRLKLAGPYEWDILFPPPAASVAGSSPALASFYRTYVPSGLADGINLLFSLPLTPSALKVFINGVHQRNGVDYTSSGSSITFTSPPPPDADIIVWTYLQG